MLDTLLKTTKLTAHAFQPKPKDLDILKNSEKFWQEEYQTLDAIKGFNSFYLELRQKHAEINQLFDKLIETIKNSIEPNQLSEESIKALQELREKYWHPFFKRYQEKIKKQLEIITYFLIVNNDFDKKMLVFSYLSETNVCPEGCYSKLQQILDDLNNKISLSSWLTDLRKAIIHRYYSCYYNNQSVHSFNAILIYTQKIGLNVLDDDTTYHDFKEDQYVQPLSENKKKEFIDFFCSQYNVRTIIEYVTEQLQLQTKQSLAPFQKEVSPFGLVIPTNITFSTINDKLIHLPIKSYSLFNTIDEDDGYFQLKPPLELRTEVIVYLLNKNILEKKTKTFKFNEENWVFNIIMGDNYGDYGFISSYVELYYEEKYLLSTFEEKKLYQYVSLEQFHANKAFFRLGQNAFNYFYKKKANFSNCYLIDIDFQALGADFISELYDTNDDDASFIRAKLTYKQLLCFYNAKKYHTLNNSYLVTITNAQQFFKIITEIIGPDKKEQASFLERHTAILTTNKLYREILQNLQDEIIKKEQDLIEAIKKINFLDGNILLLLSTETPLFIISFTLIGLWEFYYLPLIYFCTSLIFAIILVPIFFIMLEELKDNLDPLNYKNKLDALRKEETELLALDEKMIEFSNEQEKIELTTKENDENNAMMPTIAYSSNPTSISTHLLKDQRESSPDRGESLLLNNTLLRSTI
ncbi:aerotolerance-like exported protein [Candidatus Rickettsiella viridis]|uniref:Aerotolerance-like exported protein n=1 Tax=Candidatus Rickettsiella viridis TaxID=676208 RepID=A0A2Z5UUN7_9COXI|nr:hypothetical protein [Candidatus Rickettsiella viridis]BBB15269.1 aerotolerance-like exported protein [Candidatus Rickettsiella viridis]